MWGRADDMDYWASTVQDSMNNQQEKTKIINLTPHDVTIILSSRLRGDDDFTIQIPASGNVARCKVERQSICKIRSLQHCSHLENAAIVEIPITQTKFGEVEGLPDPQENTIYIVSSLVAQAVPYRNDVFIPDDCVRDSEGKIIGCRSLGKI